MCSRGSNPVRRAEPTAFGEPGFARTRDGRLLHRVRRGNGSPTVVFEAGLGACRNTWALVQPVVARSTRTLAYDRAGLGRSAPRSGPRTVQRMADDLEDLLDADGRGPYLLTGHSLGGPIVRCLTYRRPDLVAGLVLVDPVAEDCDVYYDRRRALAAVMGYRVAGLLCSGGLLDRLFGAALYRRYPADMSAESRAESLTRRAMRTGAEEMLAMADGLGALAETGRAAGSAEPRVPVVVISAGRCGPFEKRVRPTVVAAHRRFAAALPAGRHVIAADSGHLVPLHQPELIADRLLDLITSLRSPE